MHPLENLALLAAAWESSLWLYRHPSKIQREGAARTQDLRDRDWRA